MVQEKKDTYAEIDGKLYRCYCWHNTYGWLERFYYLRVNHIVKKKFLFWEYDSTIWEYKYLIGDRNNIRSKDHTYSNKIHWFTAEFIKENLIIAIRAYNEQLEYEEYARKKAAALKHQTHI